MANDTINTAEIFRAAHAAARVSARWDRAAGAYRFHFARHLREAWRKAKLAEKGRRMIEAIEAECAARSAYVAPISRGYYTARPRSVSAIGW